MKYNKGFAPLLVILLIVAIGGATYAVVPRSVLKDFFQTGDKPTEAQFSNTIDSNLHLPDDTKSLGLKEYNPAKEYLAGDTEIKSTPIYQAKVLSGLQQQFKMNSAQDVTFRWPAAFDKPEGTVTYRLKVWQLMQGQTGSQAMRSNKPIVTKDVETATEVTVSNIYTGPCKPPYLCDFVWSVELVVKDGSTVTTDSSKDVTVTGER